MALAPFREFLPLIVLNGHFDLPQHLFADLADRRAQGGDGGRGVEVEHGQEILMDEGVLRVQVAAGQKDVGGADHGGVSERRADVEVIVPLQEGTVNDAEDVALIAVPVIIHQLGGDPFKLTRKAAFAGNLKAVLQRVRYRITMFLPVLPEIRAAGVFLAAGVRYIEDISDSCLVPTGVNQGDPLAASADIPPHGLVPEIIFGAGGGVRALGEDQQLLMVRVLVQPSGGGEKGCPLL